MSNFGCRIKTCFEVRAHSRRKQKKKPCLKIYLTKILYFSLFCQLREFYHSKGESVIDVKVLNLR